MLKSKGSTYWQSKYYQVTDWDKMALQFSWTCILSNMYYVVPISTEMSFNHTFNHSLSNSEFDMLALVSLCFILLLFTFLCRAKGQLISKCLFGIFNFPKKQTKQLDFTTMVPQVELFLFIFWENWRHQKDISKLTDLYLSPFDLPEWTILLINK